MLKKLKLGILSASVLMAGQANADLIANFHENLNSGNSGLFIFGAENTTGTISGLDGFLQNFTIDATGVFSLNLGNRGREMTQNGVINNLSLRVSANNKVSGIALNRGNATTDQTNLLDVDALGKEYRVLAYSGKFGSGSQMSVTATEDNTTVTINSALALGGNAANTPFNVSLNAGETVFYESGSGRDITGTHVSADKNVAVFAGAECTQVPDGVVACDQLISQQNSIDNFGTDFLIAKNFGGGTNADLVRVLASQDGTKVFLNGILAGTINAGEFLELDNVSNSRITTDKPATVGQYVRGQGGSRTTGDPAFTIVPATNQYLDSYVFSTPIGSDAFSQNFLNVAINQADAASLKLNGTAVDTSGFTLLNGTLFGNISVGLGVGNISAANPFLATSAGFSSFDSYFNTIATSFSAGASPAPKPTPPTDVPEPASLLMLSLGLLGLSLRKKRTQ